MFLGAIPDYRHWQIPLGRRFRSLKMWFVMRLYGQDGMREHIRKQISLAHEFESLIANDLRFEISVPVTMGLVCFRLKGDNDLSEKLNKLVNDEGKIHITPTKINSLYVLRMAVCSRFTESKDMHFAYNVISRLTTKVLLESKAVAASD